MKKLLICLALLMLCTYCASAMSLKRGGSGEAAFPVRILLTGDSLMAGLGPHMQREMAGYRNISLIPIGKGSTGLSRPDFYNWPQALKENLRKHRPQMVIMWIGTNDVATSIYNVEGTDEPCSPLWIRAYANKIYEIVKICQAHNARIIFMSPPVMDRPKWDTKLARITRLMRTICRHYRLGFINTRPIFSDNNGQYTHTKRLPDGSTGAIRTSDHIHITPDGYKLVMDVLLPYMGKIIPEAKRTRNSRSWSLW